MERELIVKIKVTSDQHADLIKKDIMEVIKLRTTEFFISNLKEPDTSIEKSHLQAALVKAPFVLNRTKPKYYEMKLT